MKRAKPPQSIMDRIQADLAMVANDAARNDLQRRMNELFHMVSKQGFRGWAYLANCLFFAIKRHHGPTAAHRIFKTSGLPPEALKTAIKNADLLERRRKKRELNRKEFAHETVEENKKHPKKHQRGAGGISEDRMYDHIRELERDHKKRQAAWRRSLKQ